MAFPRLLTRLIGLMLLLAAAASHADAVSEAECAQRRDDMEQAFADQAFSRAAASAASLFGHCPIAAADWQTLSLHYAQALSRSGRNEEALSQIGRCIARDGAAQGCFLEKAAILGKLGRRDEAQLALQAARRLAPSSAAASAGPPQPPARPTPPRSGQGEKSGSGFYLSAAGRLITNAHVVAGCTRLATAAGQPLTLLAADSAIDLAVLSNAAGAATFASLRLDPPRIGEDVLAFGFPLPGILSTEGNVTVGILSATRGVGDDPHQLQITAPVQSGNSGGPLLDGAGNVIGVVVAKLDAAQIARRTGDLPQNVNFAIKATELAALLDRLKISYQRANPGPTRAVADLAQLGQAVSTQILCH
jgi:S1-C subfamily serine protease